LLFAAAEALGFRLQGVGLPSQLASATPYVLTLVALIVASVRSRRALGRAPTEPATDGPPVENPAASTHVSRE
jgi:simple sugar transport system permease protein